MNVYVSHAIRQNDDSDETRQIVQQIVATCQRFQFDPQVPTAVEGAEPTEIFQRDMEWIGESDLFIAVCDKPSHGVGWELHEALSYGIPCLCVRKAGAPLSYMLLGNDDIDHIEFDDLADLDAKIEEWIVDLSNESQENDHYEQFYKEHGSDTNQQYR